MSTPAQDAGTPIPSVATLVDLPTLINALNAVIAPTITDIKSDINSKHEENKESRHTLRNSVETTLAQINIDILSQRERVASLELKVQQAVGPDGTGGAIESLKQGQATQLAATTSAVAGVARLEAQFAEYLPTLKALRTQEDSRVLIHEKRDQAKDWAELVLKYGALVGILWAVAKHFH